MRAANPPDPRRACTGPARVVSCVVLAAVLSAASPLDVAAVAPGGSADASPAAVPVIERAPAPGPLPARDPASEEAGPEKGSASGSPSVTEPADLDGQTGEPPTLPSRGVDDGVDDGVDEQFVDDTPAGDGVADTPVEPAGPAGAGGGEHAARQRRAEQLAARFPDEAAASQEGIGANRRWALIVGVNAYQGRGVSDTLGSVPDAHALAAVLEERGWPDDHVLVLTDAEATGAMIRAGIEWLAERADENSTVVASFSGHLQHRNGTTALWPTDHDYVWADEVGDRFADVAADRMWLSFQGCHAQGLRSPQLHRDGRVITYSSKTAEKSYEDPEAGHSVQGHYLFAEGLAAGRAGVAGRAGAATQRPSVQQAFGWAAPRMHERTAGQQTPQIWDGLDEPFRLSPTE